MVMKLFNKVTIIGVGLIGGSIGLAIKKKGLAKEVTGVFRRASTMKRALRRKAIDKGSLNIEEGTRNADLIIIAAPVRAIPSLAEKAFEYAKRGAIITDAGSTKRWIVERVERRLGGRRSAFFVGSHPMAGSEQAGVESASADLLGNAPCIVTKTAATDKAALRKIVRFWSSLGANVSVMTPGEHDERVSFISHLPHLIAFSVAGAVPERFLRYAAEGFRDTTRVASSDPELWADIFLTNKKEILKSARKFEKFYRKLLKALRDDNHQAVVKLLAAAKAKRDKFKL